MDNLETLQEAFEHAISLSSVAQSEYLQQLKESDPNLHQQLIPLLTNDGQSDTFLQQPIQAALQSSQVKEDYWIGKSFGVFTATQKIASGGMGLVFRGSRQDGEFVQTVAIKILSGILASSQIQQNFENERQIFAQMRHPYIAQLYDGGISNEGVPFLIMELVEGTPIDQYCELKQLSVTQRLRLFTKVCEAVSYAHRNLIVHRDIKPSNILVTNEGIPKLLDFGIAKTIDGRTGAQQGEVTQIGSRSLTPAYASPEQIKGEVITTSSDIFSLGVLLHHLLSGGLPFEEITNKTSHFSQPTAPSITFKKRHKTSEIQTSLNTKYFKALTGDLDAIVLKCLNEESDRRYASVEALAIDIFRYIENKPVNAQKNSRLYQLKKYFTRHWFGVATSAFFVALSVAFTSYILMQTYALKKEQETSQEVIKFLEDLINLEGIESISDTYNYYNNYANVRFIELLNLGEKRLDNFLMDEPMAKSNLMNSFAISYKIAGDLEAAKRLTQGAIALQETSNSIPVIDKIALLNDYSQILLEKSEFNEAKTTLLKVMEMLDKFDNDNNYMRYRIIDNLSRVYSGLGNYETSYHYDKLKLELVNHLYGEKSKDAASATYNLSISLWHIGRFEEALVLAQKAMDVIKIQKPINYEFIADCYNFIATLLKETKPNLDQALEYYYQSLHLNENHLGKEHINLVIDLYEIARVELDKGDWRKAQAKLQRAEKIQLSNVGENSLDMIRIVNDLGEVSILTANYKTAASLLNRAETICANLFNFDHPMYADILANKARLNNQLGKDVLALDLFEQRYHFIQGKLKQEHPRVRAALFDWVNSLIKHERYKEAKIHFEADVPIYQQTDIINEIALRRLTVEAKIAQINGDYSHAQRLFQQVNQAAISLYGMHSHLYAENLKNWATNYLSLGNVQQAQQLNIQYCEVIKSLFDVSHPKAKSC